jgi:hypothetical protein
MGDVEHSFEPTARCVGVRFGGADVARTDRALGCKPPLYELASHSCFAATAGGRRHDDVAEPGETCAG